MIRINNFIVTNYRSCVKTKVEFTNDLTTLIGINGVGKSNILSSLLLLKKINRNRFINHTGPHISFAKSDFVLNISIDEKKYLLKAEVYYDSDENNLDEVYSANVKFKEVKPNSKKWIDIGVEMFHLIDQMIYLKNKQHITRVYNKQLNSENGKISMEIVTYLNNISYYSATQFSDPSKCPASIELEDSRLTKSYRANKLHDKFIYDLFTTYKNDKPRFNQYQSIINKDGIGLIDDIQFSEHELPSNSYKVKSGGKIEKIEKSKNIVIPSITVDNLNLSPNQLSEGSFKTLALIFYILNDKSDLLLIEEPEVCVHHGLLASIIELIKVQSKRKQIIISTHSDYIIDKLKPENVVLITKNSHLGTIAKTLPKSLSRDDYMALKDYLNTAGNLGEYWKEGGFEND